jgi:hypothetical protein
MATSTRKSAAKQAVPKKARVDWDAIERDYRTDKFTLRELAAKYNVTHTTIARRAEKLGWTKDLTDAIRQATNAKLVQQSVQQQCTTAHQAATDTVLIAAEINVQVIQSHRRGLQRIATIKERLLDQIEQAAALMPELSDLIEMVRKEDERGIDKANDALRKAMARSGLTDDLKKLAEIDEKVRKGEREAFGITSGEEEDSSTRKPKCVTLEFVDAVVK